MVRITYCDSCGYEPRAARAAAALKEELGVEAELVPGVGGVFQVEVDGKVVAQRNFMGLPSDQEIVNAVARIVGR
ncbi:MAG: Rdx family protein [Myxococcaceae bacterium]